MISTASNGTCKTKNETWLVGSAYLQVRESMVQLKSSLYFWLLLISLCWTFLKSMQDPLVPLPKENTFLCIYFHTVDCTLVFGHSRRVQMNRSGAGWLTEATSANCIASSKFYLYYCFCLGDYPLIQVNKHVFKWLVVFYKHLSGALLSVYPRFSNLRWISWWIKIKSDTLRIAFGSLMYNFQFILTMLRNETTSVLKKKSPRGLDYKMIHKRLLNGGIWSEKLPFASNTEEFGWLQWWLAEKYSKCQLPPWMSWEVTKQTAWSLPADI